MGKQMDEIWHKYAFVLIRVHKSSTKSFIDRVRRSGPGRQYKISTALISLSESQTLVQFSALHQYALKYERIAVTY